jgi:hypothetical protein
MLIQIVKVFNYLFFQGPEESEAIFFLLHALGLEATGQLLSMDPPDVPREI